VEIDRDRPEKTVFILQTGLTAYSTEWCASDFPEGDAMRSLEEFVQAKTGLSLFDRAIGPGDCVVIKPNLVRDWHPDGHDLYSVVTHPAIIRAVVDGVYRALHGEGQIIIADAPMADTDFDHLLAATGLERIADYYWRRHRFEILIRDLRKYRYRVQQRPGGYGYEVRSPLPGDPKGYVEVDLGSQSAFNGLTDLHLLEGTDIARRKETIASHSAGVNRYLIARTVLEADAIVGVPKLKTHSKVGITANCKGMVGINGDKNWLPHFRWGSPMQGGDQFPARSIRSIDEKRFRLGLLVRDTLVARQTAWADAILRIVQSASGTVAGLLGFQPVDPVNGDWPGNDTCWRLAADLVRVAIFADKSGRLGTTPRRRFLSIVDGIIGGEGEGPLRPTPKPCGVLLAGLHPVAVDMACARLMGFDYHKIRYLHELCQGAAAELQPGLGPLRPEEVRVFSNYQPWNELNGLAQGRLLSFAPPARWAGHMEIAGGEIGGDLR